MNNAHYKKLQKRRRNFQKRLDKQYPTCYNKDVPREGTNKTRERGNEQ